MIRKSYNEYYLYIFSGRGAVTIRYLFVINPTAGKADASAALLPRIRAAADRAGIEPSILVTQHAGHARDVTAAYAESGEKVHIYACGGDGTMNEVLQAAAGHENLSVGCIPCGSGNDYVRNFGTQSDFLDLDAQFAARSYPVDLIRTPQGYGIDIYAAGIDAQVANGIPKWRRFPLCGGTTAYTLSIVEAVCSTFRHNLHISTEQGELEGTYMMLAICNGRAYGGGYVAAPEADMQDGLLDLVLIRKIGRVAVARVIGGYKKGAHIQNGQVTPPYQNIALFRRVRRVEVDAEKKITVEFAFKAPEERDER